MQSHVLTKKAARLALGFHVAAYAAGEGPCIKVLCKLIDSVRTNAAVFYTPVSRRSHLIINQRRQTQVSGFLQNKRPDLSRSVRGIYMELFLRS